MQIVVTARVKFYVIWCRFAVITAKCLGGSFSPGHRVNRTNNTLMKWCS